MSIITEPATKHNTQIRPNLWLTSQGAVVGYGPMLAPNGFVYCFTCATDECQHVQQLDEAWIAKRDSVETISPSWYTINTGDYVARVDRVTGEVSYEDRR